MYNKEGIEYAGELVEDIITRKNEEMGISSEYVYEKSYPYEEVGIA